MTPPLLQAAAVTTVSVDPWAIAGRALTALLTVSGGVIVFTWRAVTKSLWCAMLAACRPNLKDAIDEIYRDRILVVDAAVDAVSVHADQIEGLEASIEAQGKALRDSLTDAIQRQTDSMERMAQTTAETMQRMESTLGKVHDEAAENTAAIAKVVGFMEAKGWQGAERRSRSRKGDK